MRNIDSLNDKAKIDAQWVLSFGAGTEWLDDDGSGFRPRRLAELKAAGVLVAHPSKPGILLVG